MIKTFKIPALLLMVALIFLICSFDKTPVNGKIHTTKVRAGGELLDTSMATYDDKGRLTSVTGIVSNLKFTYSHDTVFQSMPSGKTLVYRISRKGLAAYDNFNNFYYYDANGYLMTKKRGSTVLQANTISGGDITSSVTVANQTIINSTYFFYPDTDYRDRGMGFLGKTNTHLVKMQATNVSGNIDTINYSYRFDALGRVASETQSGKRNVITTLYTYEE